MSKLPIISFSKNAMATKGTFVIIIPKDCGLPEIAQSLDENGRISKAMESQNFNGKCGSHISILAPNDNLDNLILMGCGALDEITETKWMNIGGLLASLAGSADKLTILTETIDDCADISPQSVVTLAAGSKLASYKFDDYLTKGRENDKKPKKAIKIVYGTSNPASAKREYESLDGITDGVLLARQLVNEPANILGPVEFAKEASKLKKLGVKVEILGELEMKKLGMGALLGVGEGSVKPSRMAIMKWDGGKKDEQPLAFVGKGVVFDTGGISIKPASGMEDMKGDMGGAAAVTGLMHALAARKAKANVVGIIGLVENMPDGKAQRPGDIVKSMSGQTIEIINTDAEGRLVLADALWYCQKRFKPKFMIDLATLTGAILVALGKEYAGIFSNNDKLANNLYQAGLMTDEKVWRMPLGEPYDKLIDTKNADMKNSGGRLAGSITAAQFLQRFVNEVPWVHIDVAGMAMASKKSHISQGWASGYGVRLLDKLVSEFYE